MRCFRSTHHRLVLVAMGLCIVGSSELKSGVSEAPIDLVQVSQSTTDSDIQDKSFFDTWAQSTTMSGDWGGLRTDLRNKGINTHFFLNNQYQGVVNGGRSTNGFRNAASMDAIFSFDLDKMDVISNAEALLHLQSNMGGGINRRTGSTFQVNDDSDGHHGFHIGQLWYRHHFIDRRLSITLGFLDFQTIIDHNAFANSEDKQFMHQILDNNLLIPANIGLGAALTYKPTDWYTLILGIGDAQSVLYKPGFSTAFHDENRWMAYMEHDLHVHVPSDNGPLDGNYRAGMMYDPKPRAIFAKPDNRRPPQFDSGDYAFYMSVDQMLYRESPNDNQGLGIFGRFAYRTPETNRYTRFWSAGFAYRGLIPDRDADVLGLGFAITSISNDLRRKIQPHADREAVYELYYSIQVNPWLVITPDIQYIDNPGTSGDLSHALTAGIRARISF